MEEKLISFETAKLAKEKGFYISDNVKVIYTSENVDLPNINNVDLNYDEDGWCFRNKENYLKHNEVITWINAVNFTRYNHPCWLAPTQSLLQKWLREVHNLHIYIFGYNCGKELWAYEIREIKGAFVEFDMPHKALYSSFEEALEAGLQEALKLIPENE